MIDWFVEHFGIMFLILMFLWALTDRRPRYDSTRRGKRYRQRRDWR